MQATKMMTVICAKKSRDVTSSARSKEISIGRCAEGPLIGFVYDMTDTSILPPLIHEHW